MIIKTQELKKKSFKNFSLFLMYGKNEGFKNDIINNYFLKDFDGEINKYEENSFIENQDEIISELLNKSLFESQKMVIISRVTEKIYKTIQEIIEKKIINISIILKSGVLEKKSKLRNLFEKNKSLIAIPFYEDNSVELYSIATGFLQKNKINLSRESINLLINRASGDRGNLISELNKIYSFSISNKQITLENIERLTNLTENHGVNELVNNYLIKNTKYVAKILNENNYSDDDCILILRTILAKSKKLLVMIEQNKTINNIDEVISKARPPIFWKEKENMKAQLKTWNSDELKGKIYKINQIELTIKSNNKNSLNLISDFIFNY